MRPRIFLASFALVMLGAVGGQAALSKYAIRNTFVAQFSITSPRLEIFTLAERSRGSGTTVIDNDGGSGSPILARHLQVAEGFSGTINIPQLTGNIWFSSRTVQGPTAAQTGTGDNSTTIEWGFIDSWTITGGSFCNAFHAFPFLCDLAALVDEETVPPPFVSPKFDFNSWVFHLTGFRAVEGFISHTGSNMGVGNTITLYRGVLRPDGTVPALPLVAIGAVGVSFIAVGIVSLRRRG